MLTAGDCTPIVQEKRPQSDFSANYDGINKVENMNSYSSDIAEKITKEELEKITANLEVLK